MSLHIRRFALPASHRRTLTPERANSWLFWERVFTFEELQLHGLEAEEQELAAFVNGLRPPAPWMLAADRAARGVRRLTDRTAGWVQRRVFR